MPADTSEVPVLEASWKLVDHGNAGLFFYCSVNTEDNEVQAAPKSVTALVSTTTQMLQMERIYGVRHTPQRRWEGDRLVVLCTRLPAGTDAAKARRTLDRALKASPLRPSERLDLLQSASTAASRLKSRQGRAKAPFRRPLVLQARS